MENIQNLRDELIWKAAKKRVSFRRNLIAYLIVHAFLWAVWFMSEKDYTGSFVPWPLWSMIGWGIGLLFQYFDAYVFYDKTSAVEKEYEKIKSK